MQHSSTLQFAVVSQLLTNRLPASIVAQRARPDSLEMLQFAGRTLELWAPAFMNFSQRRCWSSTNKYGGSKRIVESATARGHTLASRILGRWLLHPPEVPMV